eukprot:CAMPEP_0176201012 /NCGR_PEP_ID=MMETSP0121_2-20121125/9350_1 /TAXON_ID=160619 /ORGANISM="Kryptoperidinium foliaceum, Strain CCMP 1326" /LENGTH=733 /DNA_ID=CAMNT_0017539883 /DNA_START=85 /DNA_END=2283 /DNA_ORIENTATION=-
MTLARVLLVSALCAAEALAENPLGKVIQLMDDLAAKVTREGEEEAKAFSKYMEWCDDAAKNAKFSIEDATSQKAKLEAKISEYASDSSVATGKVEELGGAIAESEGELKDAALVREKEASDFAASEKELVETIDALGRAITMLEREMSKNPAALTQLQVGGAKGAIQALSALVDAASLSSSDKGHLQALLQQQQQDDSEVDDDVAGAPAAAAYKSHSAGIFDVLEDLKEKAEGQLGELRKAEVNSKHNYEMLRQSLEDQKEQDTKSMEAQKMAKAEADEGKASAEGDLQRTVETLKTSSDELATTQNACMSTAADHEATKAGRAEELKVIAEAKKILTETSSGAVSQSYSFGQLWSSSSSGTQMRTRADLARLEVVTMVRNLAKKHHSAALSQLASRVAAVARYGGANGEDVFAKVRGMIQDMIEKLEREAGAEATEKAYCDEQIAKTEAKRDELSDDVAKLTAKIDSAASRSAELKEQVKALEGELAAITREQAQMDKMRQETHAAYSEAKSDVDLGLTGVRKALALLREYYGAGAAALVQDDKPGAFMQQPAAPEKHDRASGAGTGIIGILEVVESDFAKNLAQEEQQEADAESEYQKVTQENKITKATKEQDVKYKTQEFKSLDKTLSELSSDRESTNAELAAVLEYDAKIKERCIAKPESYEERRARRQAEIEGLKSALRTLEEETALLQHGRKGGAAAAASGAPTWRRSEGEAHARDTVARPPSRVSG